MTTAAPQRNYLEVSRRALVHNAMALHDYIQVPIIAVVKCDGYGVSICEAARAWAAVGVNTFAVSDPREAMQLRAAGFREDILLLSPVADQKTLEAMVEREVTLTVTSLENARLYSLWAKKPVGVHVAVDTGMGRFGVPWQEVDRLLAIYRQEGLVFRGIFSHFAKSYEEKYCQTRRQMERFLQVTGALESRGIQPGIRHIANSCAALRFRQTWLDAVRIGSALVGRLCAPTDLALEPVAALKAQVVDIRAFSPGDTTGYGARCRLRRDTLAAVVALGREEGFGVVCTPDNLPLWDKLAWLRRRGREKRWVEFAGYRLPLLGRVGNQFTLFEVGQADIRPGDYVTVPVEHLLPAQNRVFV